MSASIILGTTLEYLFGVFRNLIAVIPFFSANEYTFEAAFKVLLKVLTREPFSLNPIEMLLSISRASVRKNCSRESVMKG